MKLPLRAVLNAILYVVVTGCQWRDLPKEYPHPKSVYYHFRKWSKDGTWQRINRTLHFLERRRVGRFPRASAAIIDSQSVKTTHAGPQRGYDSNKKVKGRKRHIVVDTQGNLLEVAVTAANLSDAAGAKVVLTKLDALTASRLHKLWADQAYQGELVSWLHNHLFIQLEVVKAASTQIGFVVQLRRWIVEAPFLGLDTFGGWLLEHSSLAFSLGN